MCFDLFEMRLVALEHYKIELDFPALVTLTILSILTVDDCTKDYEYFQLMYSSSYDGIITHFSHYGKENQN